MRILWKGFLAKSHSWSVVAQNISRQLIRQGHQVDLFSTNGLQYFPEDLKPNLIGYAEENQSTKIYGSYPDKNYDCTLSYTCMKNFRQLLSHSPKNRLGIWCYEWSILPDGFARQHIFADKILAPSNFARDIFVNNGIPAEKVLLVPHGINLEDYQNVIPYPLKTKKTRKILVNIGQPHKRKNIPGILQSFATFQKDDDVCLIAKISAKRGKLQPFEVDVFDIFNKFKKKYPNHAEIELITEYVPNIASLYLACDIVFTMSYSEGFYLPAIEAIATNKINVAPRFSGQLDFLNDENSILIDGKMIRADPAMQYWQSSPYNGCFEANVDQAAEKLRDVVLNYDDYLKKFSPKMQEILPNYSWANVASKIISQCV